ncbi:hypothetical protein EON62_03220, partial [archaeon]
RAPAAARREQGNHETTSLLSYDAQHGQTLIRSGTVSSNSLVTGAGVDDTDSEGADEVDQEDASTVSVADDTPNAERYSSLLRQSKRRVVFEFDATIPTLGVTWHLRKSTVDFIGLYRALRKVYGVATPDFPRDVRFARDFRERRTQHRRLVARKLRYFLTACLELPKSMDCIALRDFLELSWSSMDPRLGPRYKEGYLLTSNLAVNAMCSSCIPSWTRYWFVCRDSYIVAYENSRSTTASQVILFDAGLEVHSGAVMPVVGCGTVACMPTNSNNGADPKVLNILTDQGRVVLVAPNKKEAEDCTCPRVACINRLTSHPPIRHVRVHIACGPRGVRLCRGPRDS